MGKRLGLLLSEFDDVLAVLRERVETRTPLQAPTALSAIRHIEQVRRDITAALSDEDVPSRDEKILRAGLELQTAAEELEDCTGEAFPRIATSLYGIAEELQGLGATEK